MTIYTIGHSTRELGDFIAILRHYGIGQLVDVRTVPRSRHTPQFNSDTIGRELSKQNITYYHLADLGGLRKANKISVNTAWRNASFRGYADYMQTAEFDQGLKELTDLSAEKTTAIMCAEAVPWRCHRSMIGDALLVRGHKVVDIFDSHKTQDEKLPDFAQVIGFRITYPKIK